jgi:hypothetical protein
MWLPVLAPLCLEQPLAQTIQGKVHLDYLPEMADGRRFQPDG